MSVTNDASRPMPRNRLQIALHILMLHGGPGVDVPDAVVHAWFDDVPELRSATVVVPSQRALTHQPPWSTAQDIADVESLRLALVRMRSKTFLAS